MCKYKCTFSAFFIKKLHPEGVLRYIDSTLRIEFPTTSNIGFGGDGCLGY